MQKDPDTTDLDERFGQEVKELLSSGQVDVWVRGHIGLAQFPFLSLDDRKLICRKLAWREIRSIALNPDTPRTVLQKLCDGLKLWLVAHVIIENPNCPTSVLERLLHGYSSPARWVAAHKNCSPFFLKRFIRGQRHQIF